MTALLLPVDPRHQLADATLRLDPIIVVSLADQPCLGCPCVACQEETAVGSCEVVWSTPDRPGFDVDDVCTDCLLGYLEDWVLRERPDSVEVTLRRLAPSAVTA